MAGTKYALVEMDETDGVGWRLYKASNGTELGEWDDRPTDGQIAKAKADRQIPADSNRPNKAAMLAAFEDVFEDNYYTIRESHPRYPPWQR